MGQVQDITTRRKWKQLQSWERSQIEALLKARHSIKEIAQLLGRDRRTIQREMRKGTVQQLDGDYRDVWRYFGDAGQRVAQERAANKGRPLAIGHNHALCHELERLIVKERYSPDAALGWLRHNGPPGMVTICTKTLYRYIDCELFAGISSKNLPVKRGSRKHTNVYTARLTITSKGKASSSAPSR